MICELVKKTRTFRRFAEEERLDGRILMDLVDAARLGGSARNGQVLKYMIVRDRQLCGKIFPLLGWAGYLKDWPGPVPGERPPAYIICLLDRELLKGPETEAHFDLGIATQNLLLAAMEIGIGGCRIGAFSPRLAGLLNLADSYKVLLVLALGYPREKVVLDTVGGTGDIRYWRDEEDIHHVPKRSLAEIIIPYRPNP